MRYFLEIKGNVMKKYVLLNIPFKNWHRNRAKRARKPHKSSVLTAPPCMSKESWYNIVTRIKRE